MSPIEPAGRQAGGPAPDGGPNTAVPSEYDALRARVDAFSERAMAAQQRWLPCAPGCDLCCRTARTAFAVEVAALRRWLLDRPAEEIERLQARRATPAVRAGQRCVFLADDGRCDVYPARPLLCRTHGPAVREPGGRVSCCELCFAGLSPAEVEATAPPDSVLDLDLLNRMLVLINEKFRAGQLVAPPGGACPPAMAPRARLEEALP